MVSVLYTLSCVTLSGQHKYRMNPFFIFRKPLAMLFILDDTWSSGQLVRSLVQVPDSHLFECRPPLG